MPYDEGLAQRIREALEAQAGLTEKRMFGGVAFLVDGKMAVGIVRDDLMVRVGPGAYEAVLTEPHVREMDFTGRPLRGMVYVAPEGIAEDDELAAWLRRGVDFAASEARAPVAAKRKRPARHK